MPTTTDRPPAPPTGSPASAPRKPATVFRRATPPQRFPAPARAAPPPRSAQPARRAPRPPSSAPRDGRGRRAQDNYVPVVAIILFIGVAAGLAWAIISAGSTSDSPAPQRDSFFDGKPPASVAEAALAPPTAANATILAPAKVQLDEAGRPTQIVGVGPASVLAAYCSQRPGEGRLEPVGVVMGVPRSSRYRVGLFRDVSRPDQPLRAIRIWRDPRNHTWLAGDGKDPISAEAPPPAATTETPPATIETAPGTTEGAAPTAGAPLEKQR